MNSHSQGVKPTFKYSRSNKVFFAVVLIAWIALIVIAPPQNPFASGERFGVILFLWMFPTLFAWIVWLISRRSGLALSATFNICLALAVFGQIAQLSKKVQQSATLKNLQSYKQSLADVFEQEGIDGASIDDAKLQYYAKVRKTLEDLAGSTTGKESEFYSTMLKFSVESQNADMKRETAFTEVLDESILDFSTIHSTEELERQKQIIGGYVSQTIEYREFFLDSPDRAAKALEPFGDDFALAVGALRGAKNKYEQLTPEMVPYLEASIEYGNVMLQILDLLDDEMGNWSYGDEEVQFESDDVLSKFNNLVTRLQAVETTLNELSEKLVQLM